MQLQPLCRLCSSQVAYKGSQLICMGSHMNLVVLRWSVLAFRGSVQLTLCGSQVGPEGALRGMVSILERGGGGLPIK